MESNINVWMLCAIIPVIMANYIFPANQGATHHDDVVSVLVAQVKDLQNVVTEQGRRIESLEKRLEDRERVKNPQPGTKDANHHGNEVQTEEGVGDDADEQLTATDKDGEETSGPFPGDEVHIPVGNKNTGSLSRGIRASENVAFSAYLDHSMIDMGLGQAVKCNKVLLNDGNHYNTHSGTFVAPVSGVYLFAYHLLVGNSKAAVELVVDDNNLVEAVVRPNSGHGVMGGNTAVLRVVAGQTLWLQTNIWNDAELYSSEAERYVTFSGYLIYST